MQRLYHQDPGLYCQQRGNVRFMQSNGNAMACQWLVNGFDKTLSTCYTDSTLVLTFTASGSLGISLIYPFISSHDDHRDVLCCI
jgi:hypothetical protein